MIIATFCWWYIDVVHQRWRVVRGCESQLYLWKSNISLSQ